MANLMINIISCYAQKTKGNSESSRCLYILDYNHRKCLFVQSPKQPKIENLENYSTQKGLHNYLQFHKIHLYARTDFVSIYCDAQT